MPKQKEEVNSKEKAITKVFSVDELNKALFDFEDLMERCLTPFMILDETANCLNDRGRLLDGDRVSVGVEVRYLTPEVLSTIETYKGVKLDKEQKSWMYMVDEVPVVVKLIHRKYKFFENPDRKFYFGGDYLCPNPFDRYYKSRFIIQ